MNTLEQTTALETSGAHLNETDQCWPREERAFKTEMIRKNISAFGVDVLKDTFDAGLGDLAVFKTTKIRPTSSPTVISTRDLKESELIPESLDDRRREGECSCRRRKCKM